MSQNVRQYLNDPDLMFRRFRCKIGEEDILDGEGNVVGKKPIYQKKWKKRIRKPDGTYGFIDYDKDSYKTGSGVYKSSAKNAMRVARTETNIAYRRADHERWQQMDFVLGKRIELSRSHPDEDICDTLAGEYPKDFVFDGWHPQCFCVVTPIMISDGDMSRITDMMAKGENWQAELARIQEKHSIKDYPENFKSWVKSNADKIEASRKRGTEPYFIQNNARVISGILNTGGEMALASQQIANQNHAEQVNKTANNVISVATNRFKDFSIDTTALDAAIKSGDPTIVQAETRSLALQLSQKQKQLKKTASNVLEVASKYKDLKGASDTTSLSDIMKTNNVSAINVQTRALAQRVKTIKQKLNVMGDVLYNVDDWARIYTIKELKDAHNAVQAMYEKLIGKSLKEIRAALAYEVQWKKDHSKYSTDKVVQQAYEERVKRLDEAIKWQDIKQVFKEYQTKFAAIFPTLLRDLSEAIAAKNISIAQTCISALKPWDKVISERINLSVTLGSANIGLLKDVDNAIRAKDITAASDALTKLNKFKDIIIQRSIIATVIESEYPTLLTELDDAISKNKPVVAKKAIDVLKRWSKVIEQLKKSEAAKPTEELKTLIAELKKYINAKKINEAEGLANKIKPFTMSALEAYCDKHYTEDFTVSSQESYDIVMRQMGKVTQLTWQNASSEEKKAFVDYCGSHSGEILRNIASGKKNRRADCIDRVMAQIKYPHDIVLRSGQNFCMAEYIFNADFRRLLEEDKINELNAKYAGLIGRMWRICRRHSMNTVVLEKILNFTSSAPRELH